MVVAAVRTAWAGERGLCAVGAAGVVLALVCLAGVAVRGRFITPEGKLLDAATFCFGVGVFTITVALLLPLAGYAPTARRRWRRGFYVVAVYGLVLESLQAFRGLDPRFREEGGQVDVIAGVIFGLTALSNTILFVLLGQRYFRSDGLADRVVLRLGIRYGVAAVGLSFAVGIMMSIDLRAGVHGVQAIPVELRRSTRASTARPRPTRGGDPDHRHRGRTRDVGCRRQPRPPALAPDSPATARLEHTTMSAGACP